MGEKAQWIDPKGTKYQVNGIGITVLGGKQIMVDTEVLENSQKQINLAAENMLEAQNFLVAANGDLNLLIWDLAGYLDSKIFVANEGIFDLIGLGQNESSNIQRLVSSLEKTIMAYQREEQVANSYFQGLLLQSPAGFIDNSCQVTTVGAVECVLQEKGLTAKPISQIERPGILATMPSQMIAQLTKISGLKQAGILRIQKHITDGKISWSVYIPGTREWAFNTKTPQDLSTNLQTNFGQISDMTLLVAASLKKAGYKAGQPVEMIGHSQGGAVAYQFAADRNLQKTFNVRSVLTLGSNIGAVAPRKNVRVLALENELDVVPKLDGRNNPLSTNLTTVHGVHPSDKKMSFGDYCSPKTYIQRHDQRRYQRLARALEASNDPSYTNWAHQRKNNLGLNKQTKTVETDYELIKSFGGNSNKK